MKEQMWMHQLVWRDLPTEKDGKARLFVKVNGKWAEFVGQPMEEMRILTSFTDRLNGRKYTTYTFEFKNSTDVVAVEYLTGPEFSKDAWAGVARAFTVLVGRYNALQAAREILPLTGKEGKWLLNAAQPSSWGW